MQGHGALAPGGEVDAEIGHLEHVPPRDLWADDRELLGWLRGDLATVAEALDRPVTPLAAGPQGFPDANVVRARDDEGRTLCVVADLGESTDRTLGALLGGVAATGAHRGIWICSAPRDEHAASVAWLNRSIDAEIYLMRLDAVRIGSSLVAPQLRVVVRPGRASDRGAESQAGTGGHARRADDQHGPVPGEA